MTRAERNIRWIEALCRVPEGKHQGQPLKVAPFMRDDFRKIYDNPNGTRRAILSRGRKNAKALALDTPIPTPTGWKAMADIQPGDYVYGVSGQPVRVLAVSGVFIGKPCYQVGFSDGSSVVASGDHLWTTRHRYRPWVAVKGNGSGNGGRPVVDVVTTEQIAQSVLVKRADGGVERNHKIDAAATLQSDETELHIDPYVLGAWLGDGTSRGATFTASEEDAGHFVKKFKAANCGDVQIRRYPNRAPTICVRRGGLETALRLAGLLRNKHIPSVYYDAGTDQRWSLLQGLMDTDGTVNRCGGKTTPRCSFTSNREVLAYGVWRLARSLGLKATIRIGRAKIGQKDCGPCWFVSFPASKESPVFALPRKQTLLPDALARRSRTLTINSCDAVESVPTKCIKVDAPDSLFLAGHGCVPTHNTVEAALIALLHLVGPEATANSEIYSAAQSRDQAAILFKRASQIIRMSPDLMAVVTIRDTAKELVCPELGTFYKALSAEASTAFGLSPKVVIHDELGQVRGPRSELYEALETATAAQDEPLSIVISTQAPTDADLLSVLIDDALAGHDPRVVVSLHTAPQEDDPFADETIRKANPAFDLFMNANEVRAMANDAKRMPSREAEYRNLILNQRVEARSPFISRSIWAECGGPLALDWSGAVYGGLDLSSVSDLTALVLVSQIEGAWNVRPTFWLPETGLADKARIDRVPYDVWHAQGDLDVTPGATVEYEYIAARLRAVFDEYDVRALAFDRWGFKHLKPWLERAGFTEDELGRFVEFGQGFASMSPALRDLESAILQKRLVHANHPVLTMCAANAVVQSDPSGNRKLAKDKSTGRIDGMVALAMAVSVAGTHEPEGGGPSVYETRGPLFL